MLVPVAWPVRLLTGSLAVGGSISSSGARLTPLARPVCAQRKQCVQVCRKLSTFEWWPLLLSSVPRGWEGPDFE